MNSILATEVTPQPDEKPAALPPLEAWATNERMRHIPSLEWMIRKIDVDVRKRLEILLSPVGSLENGGKAAGGTGNAVLYSRDIDAVRAPFFDDVIVGTGK